VNYPSEFKYSKDHEWINVSDDGTALIGITDHAQDQLGDIVFVELPEVGSQFEKSDVFAVVESVKAAVDCYIPVSGEIVAVNEELENQAEMINTDPHDKGWIIKVKLDNMDEISDLISNSDYESYLAEQD